MRRGVLGGLAAVAVLSFLVAPSDGLFARVPLMVLCGVLAVIWHLAVTGPAVAVSPEVSTFAPAAAPTTTTDPSDGPTETEEPPVPVARPAGYFEVEAVPVDEEAPVPSASGEVDEDLSGLPDPPANWPGGVEVPQVFRSADEHVAAEPLDVIGLIDLTDPGDPLEAAIRTVEVVDVIEVVELNTSDEDPWLAFAAAMFRDDRVAD